MMMMINITMHFCIELVFTLDLSLVLCLGDKFQYWLKHRSLIS